MITNPTPEERAVIWTDVAWDVHEAELERVRVAQEDAVWTARTA